MLKLMLEKFARFVVRRLEVAGRIQNAAGIRFGLCSIKFRWDRDLKLHLGCNSVVLSGIPPYRNSPE